MSRRRRVVVTLASVGLLAGLVAVAVAWARRGADQASFSDAADRFQQSTGTSLPSLATPAPAPGVYRYTGDGTEQLSLLGTQQAWGPELPGTVVAGATPGCWSLRVGFSTNHWQETDYCLAGGALQETGGRTWQRFDLVALQVEDTVTFSCQPANDLVRFDAPAGATWTHACTGHSDTRGTTVTTRGTTTQVARETVEVGTARIDAWHQQVVSEMSGDQQGTETSDIWYAVDTGQLVRAHRSTRVDSPSPMGPVTYTEDGGYQLADASPGVERRG